MRLRSNAAPSPIMHIYQCAVCKCCAKRPWSRGNRVGDPPTSVRIRQACYSSFGVPAAPPLLYLLLVLAQTPASLHTLALTRGGDAARETRVLLYMYAGTWAAVRERRRFPRRRGEEAMRRRMKRVESAPPYVKLRDGRYRKRCGATCQVGEMELYLALSPSLISSYLFNSMFFFSSSSN